jgi:hypothetical protein
MQEGMMRIWGRIGAVGLAALCAATAHAETDNVAAEMAGNNAVIATIEWHCEAKFGGSMESTDEGYPIRKGGDRVKIAACKEEQFTGAVEYERLMRKVPPPSLKGETLLMHPAYECLDQSAPKADHPNADYAAAASCVREALRGR